MSLKRKLSCEEMPLTKRRRGGELPGPCNLSGRAEVLPGLWPCLEEGRESPSMTERSHGISSTWQRGSISSCSSNSSSSSSGSTTSSSCSSCSRSSSGRTSNSSSTSSCSSCSRSSSDRTSTSSSSCSRSSCSKSSSCSSTSSSTNSSTSQESLTAERNEGPIKATLARQISDENLTASFNAKYTQQNPLQKGGFGQVFAGRRRTDDFPVAIKYIPTENVQYEETDQSGIMVPSEVEIMQWLFSQRDGSEAASAPVALLDYYELEDQLILVMERPVPCEDLIDYVQGHTGSLTEEEAKVIVKQTIAALLELERRCVFHRDIKLENILIENGGEIPRVRIIDFGLSTIAGRESIFDKFNGTPCHIPPECKSCGTHAAGPTTVWQLGALVYELLHEARFETHDFMAKTQKICRTLSQDCQNFLRKCLTIHPQHRSTLSELLQHQWMQ